MLIGKIILAIYHFSVKAISRSDGRSAVACSAYRSAEKLIDKKYGKEQDYTKKNGVEFTNIYSPQNTDKELLNRNDLWNKVEQVENRKNSLLAREFEIAFPCELNEKQRKEMLDDLCSRIVKKYNVVVDAAIHAPDLKGGTDERNYHAHIMFTARSIDKKTGQFSKTKYRDFSRDNGTQIVDDWRAEFAEITNHHLQKAGQKVRVNHLSYKDQRLDLEATKHEGSKATELRRQHTNDKEIILPEVCKNNDVIKKSNAEKIQNKIDLSSLENEIITSEKIIIDLIKSRKKVEADLQIIEKEQQLRIEREKDREQFLELQEQYKNFADNYFLAINEQRYELNLLENQYEKSQKWLSKQDNIYEKEGVFYNASSYEMINSSDIKKPDFWIAGYKYQQNKTKINSHYEQQFTQIIRDTNIKKVVAKLRETANRIIERNDELPTLVIEKQSFFKRLFKKDNYYHHGYETLHDYDKYVSKKVEEVEIKEISRKSDEALMYERNHAIKQKEEKDAEHERKLKFDREQYENSSEYKKEKELERKEYEKHREQIEQIKRDNELKFTNNSIKIEQDNSNDNTMR